MARDNANNLGGGSLWGLRVRARPYHTSPKRERGRDSSPSLALRASVGIAKENHYHNSGGGRAAEGRCRDGATEKTPEVHMAWGVFLPGGCCGNHETRNADRLPTERHTPAAAAEAHSASTVAARTAVSAGTVGTAARIHGVMARRVRLVVRYGPRCTHRRMVGARPMACDRWLNAAARRDLRAGAVITAVQSGAVFRPGYAIPAWAAMATGKGRGCKANNGNGRY